MNDLKENIKINLKDRLTTSNRSLFQYDYNRKLEIYNTGLSVPNLWFQFIQNGEQVNQLGEYDAVNDCYNVNFPDKFLLNDSEVNCFVYLSDGESGKTIKIINFQIFDREMFDPIPDEETEDLIGQLIAKVNEFQESLEDFALTDEQMEAIVNTVIEQVKTELNMDNYYTKEEVDEIKQDIWYPTIDTEGNITWEKSLVETAPATVNVKGEKGDKGDKGDQGEKGADGQDGQDYILTEEDKTEITNNLKSYVDESILGGEF